MEYRSYSKTKKITNNNKDKRQQAETTTEGDIIAQPHKEKKPLRR